MAPATVSKTDTPGGPATAEPIPERGMPDAGAAPPAAESDEPAASTEAMLLRASLDAAQPAETPADTTTAAAIEAELADALADSMGEAPAPQIEVRATDEGVVISLTDDVDFSMFDIGSAVPNPRMVLAMDEVASALAGRPGAIIIRGFTDGRPFRSDTYDNWRLSTARAHMAYYMLTRGGVDGVRITRIEGHADRKLKNADDPNAAENRRIEILLTEPVS
jgi:chemotaxis protein MotB